MTGLKYHKIQLTIGTVAKLVAVVANVGIIRHIIMSQLTQTDKSDYKPVDLRNGNSL